MTYFIYEGNFEIIIIDNMFKYNIIFNIALPVLILTKLSKENYLGPTYALLLALSLPIGYGIYEFIKTKKINTAFSFGISQKTNNGFVIDCMEQLKQG